eukprot:16230_1
MNVLQAFVMLFFVALVAVSASDAHDDDGKRSLRHGMPRILNEGGESGESKQKNKKRGQNNAKGEIEEGTTKKKKGGHKRQYQHKNKNGQNKAAARGNNGHDHGD